MRQVEVSRTIVFDAPHRARSFFEALIADNLDLGRPENVELIFGRAPKGRTGRPPKTPPGPSAPPSTAPSSTRTTRAWW